MKLKFPNEKTRSKEMIISSFMYGQTVYHSIYINLKHISVVICITAVDESMTSFFVSP